MAQAAAGNQDLAARLRIRAGVFALEKCPQVGRNTVEIPRRVRAEIARTPEFGVTGRDFVVGHGVGRRYRRPVWRGLVKCDHRYVTKFKCDALELKTNFTAL